MGNDCLYRHYEGNDIVDTHRDAKEIGDIEVRREHSGVKAHIQLEQRLLAVIESGLLALRWLGIKISFVNALDGDGKLHPAIILARSAYGKPCMPNLKRRINMREWSEYTDYKINT